MRAVLFILGCVCLSVGGQYCMKIGAMEEPIDSLGTWMSTFLKPTIVLGLFLWTLSTALWVLVLNREQLSFAYTLYGLTYVLTPMVAVLVLGESLQGWRLAGTITVAIGVLMCLWGRIQEL